MQIKKKHVKQAQKALHQVYFGSGAGVSVFHPAALTGKGDTNRRVHIARAKIICGNLFTLGLSNLYQLYKGADGNRKLEERQVFSNKVAHYAKQHHQKYGLDEEWFRLRLLFDLGLAKKPPDEDTSHELNYVLRFLEGEGGNAEIISGKVLPKHSASL